VLIRARWAAERKRRDLVPREPDVQLAETDQRRKNGRVVPQRDLDQLVRPLRHPKDRYVIVFMRV
jgi:hypothetical protein